MLTEKILKVDPEHGLLYTLSEMNRLERLSTQTPTFVKFVYDTFDNNCTACYPGKIWRYMHDNFMYLPDEHDETIRAPHVLIEQGVGDCDDFALFTKTCLDILGGWTTKYLLLGREREQFSHIAVFAYRGRSLFRFIDPVVIDGVNKNFNSIKSEYKFRRLTI